MPLDSSTAHIVISPVVCFEIVNTLFSDRFLQNFRLTATKFFSNLHQPITIKQTLEIFIGLLILLFQPDLEASIITMSVSVPP